VDEPTREQSEALIDAAGLDPRPADEREAIIARHAQLREGIERLYDVPVRRYEDLGLRFEADPALPEWPAAPPARSERRSE
jgi:hypothetical protein